MATSQRLRREPPAFRPVRLERVESLSPRLVRITLAGPELAGLTVPDPAASVRLLLPSDGTAELVMPTWNGNEFLLPDGKRPVLRTFTPRRVRTEAAPSPELDIDVVVHGGGAASTWASRAGPGEPAAVSGPGRGYAVDPDTPGWVLAGDETAIPAISQLLEVLPPAASLEVVVEVADPAGRLALPPHPGASVEWCDLPPGAPPGDALVAAVQALTIEDGVRVWAAGEAAAVQRIRRHLFEDRGLPRSRASIRGYWKHGRAGDSAESAS